MSLDEAWISYCGTYLTPTKVNQHAFCVLQRTSRESWLKPRGELYERWETVFWRPQSPTVGSLLKNKSLPINVTTGPHGISVLLPRFLVVALAGYRVVTKFRNKTRQVSSAEGASRQRGMGHAPPEYFEILRLRNALFSIFRIIFFREVNLGPKSRRGSCLVLPHASYSPKVQVFPLVKRQRIAQNTKNNLLR